MFRSRGYHFNCVHRYAHPDWAEKKNRQVYGSRYTPLGQCSAFVLEVTLQVDSPIEGDFPLEEPVQTLLSELNGCDMSSGLIDWKHKPTTLESILELCWYRLKSNPLLYSLVLRKGPELWARRVRHDSEILVGSRYQLNCLHKHENLDLSAQANKELYGKCSAIHGHEYQVDVCLKGLLNQESWMLYSHDWLDQLMKKQVLQHLDKTYLNDIVGNTSGELIVNQLQQLLAPHIDADMELSLRVQETRKNSFYTNNLVPFLEHNCCD